MELVETTKMSERGQVVVPMNLRKFIKADKETTFAVSAIDENTLVFKKIDFRNFSEDFRKFRAKVKKVPQSTIDYAIKEYRRSVRH